MIVSPSLRHPRKASSHPPHHSLTLSSLLVAPSIQSRPLSQPMPNPNPNYNQKQKQWHRHKRNPRTEMNSRPRFPPISIRTPASIPSPPEISLPQRAFSPAFSHVSYDFPASVGKSSMSSFGGEAESMGACSERAEPGGEEGYGVYGV